MDLKKSYTRKELMVKKKVASGNKVSVRHTNVLLEDLDKKIEMILEGHDSLDKKIDDFRHETRSEIGFLRLSDRVATNKLTDLVLKIDRIEDKYDKNFKIIMEYLARIDDEIQDLKTKLVAKADLERLEKLEHRIVQVELVVKKYYGKNSN